jgi:hypothetical protein
MSESCNIRLWGASLDAQSGDALDCTIGGPWWPRARGDAIAATVVECPSSYHSLKARIEGLRIHPNYRASRDLFECAEVEFFINRNGRACTSLWWK